VCQVEEEMRQLLQETANNKKTMEEKIKWLTVALTTGRQRHFLLPPPSKQGCEALRCSIEVQLCSLAAGKEKRPSARATWGRRCRGNPTG
ncbi:hypothetical protein E2320_011510, partial [Naja naja]